MRGPDLKTAYVDQWKGGMDTRPGMFADFKSFRELTNCVVSVNGNVRNRPPVKSFGVTLDSDCQGWLYNNGVWNTVARFGATVTHTGANASLVNTLYFDPPEYTTSDWTLLAFAVFKQKPVAIIRHTYLGATITSKIVVHVWDEKSNYPTYVTDPAAPQSWSLGTYPLWPYSATDADIGVFADYAATGAIGGEKLVVSRADGSAAFSAISRARVWNTRTTADIEKTGAMYYFTMPTGGAAVFTLPENGSDVSSMTKFAAYVAEKLGAGGAWTRLTEVTGTTPTTGQFSVGTISPPSWQAAESSFVGMRVYFSEAADTVLRVRLLATPEVAITSGGTYQPANITITGDGALTDFNMGVPSTGFGTTWIGKLSGTDISSYYDVTDLSGVALVQFKRFSQTLAYGTNAATRALSVAVNAGGSGYSIGDKIDIDNTGGGPGGGPKVRVTVATLSGSAVATVTIDTATQAYLLRPSGIQTTTKYTGSGSGATMTVTWGTQVAAAQVALPYAAVADTSHFATSLTLNGAAFTTYTASAGDTSASTWISWNTPASVVGQPLSGKIILNDTIAVIFDASQSLVSAGTCTFEGVSYSFNAGAKTLLTGSAAYICVQVSGGVASVVALPTASTLRSVYYTTFILGSVDALGAYTPFKYSYASNNEWYAARHLENLSYWQGVGEAGFINTSTRNARGGVLSSMISVKNRMLFCYPQSTQLWQFDPDPTLNSYIDRYDFGTVSPMSLFYEQVMLNSQRGPRLFELTGFNYQALTDTNVGEPLNSIGAVGITAAAFWPWFGGYVAFGSVAGADTYAERAKLPSDSVLRNSSPQAGFWILSFSKESQTSAWSWNPVSGISSVQWQVMSPVDDKVYFVSGQAVYYLDGSATDAIDAPSDTAMSSRAVTHFSHVENPGVLKRFISLDLAMTGSMSITADFHPWGSGGKPAQWGPALVDATIDTPRIPFGFTGVAAALDISATDGVGFELQFLDIKYIMCGRK